MSVIGSQMETLVTASTVLLQLLSSAVGGTSVKLPELKKIELPNGFLSVPEGVISKRYADTSCVNIAKSKTTKPVGFICTSSNREFVRDMGIRAGSAAPVASENDSASGSPLFSVSSAMSKYAMTNFASASKFDIYAARVDCDETNGAVYRPTSTCHIGFSSPNEHLFVYSNFVLKNHTNGAQKIHENDIRVIWSSFQLELRP